MAGIHTSPWDRGTHKPGNVSTEVRVTPLPGGEHRSLPANHRKPEARQEQTPTALEGPLPEESLVWGFSFQNGDTGHCWC